MAGINMGSILAKAQACMNTPKKQREVRNTIDQVVLGKMSIQQGMSVHTPEEAAAKFIEVLRNTIASSGLSAGAVNAISGLNHGSAHSIGNNQYIIDVYFDGDMSRPSLVPSKYGGINDLAELFDEGVDHEMRPVHGTWHGHETWSRTVIPGTHFMEQAISDFMGNYASEYNVISITTT